MGNKDVGRTLRDMPQIEYMEQMGANVSRNHNGTGIAPTNFEVFKYFRILRNYAVNRIKWTSPQISEQELKMIEWNIFHFGFCAMLKPDLVRNRERIILSETPMIYRCAYSRFNARNGEPIEITIVNNSGNSLGLRNQYNDNEFVIFSDEYVFQNQANPFIHVAWEFACKLHELDLAFNANSHRNRMPFVFSNANMDVTKNGQGIVFGNQNGSVAELMRSAYGRNEQFVEISDVVVGKDGFMYEPKNVDNHILEHIESQKKLYQAYLELLGLYTQKEKSGVYTVRKLQENGDESPDFITECLKIPRYLCAKRACEMFGIELKMEVV